MLVAAGACGDAPTQPARTAAEVAATYVLRAPARASVAAVADTNAIVLAPDGRYSERTVQFSTAGARTWTYVRLGTWALDSAGTLVAVSYAPYSQQYADGPVAYRGGPTNSLRFTLRGRGAATTLEDVRPDGSAWVWARLP